MDDYTAVSVQYHQMQVLAGGDPAYLDIYTVGDDLVHLTGENTLTVFTGPHTGEVDVRVRTGTAAPADEPGWIVASEATLWCPDGSVMVSGLMGDCPADLSDIRVPGPGLVRVQVRARGLRAEEFPEPEQPPEQYELHVWPVPTDTGVRTVRPDDGRPGWVAAPAKAAAWAVDRMITRANPDDQRRNVERVAGVAAVPVPRVDVRRRGSADVAGAVLGRTADVLGAAPDGDDLLLPAGDLRIRLHPLPAEPDCLRFRWTWEPAPVPLVPRPLTGLPDDLPSEVDLRPDPATGGSVVHHRGVRGPDAVLLGLFWEHFLDRAERLGGDAPAAHPWEPPFAARAEAAQQAVEASRRQMEDVQARMWGGRPPSERLRAIAPSTGGLARLDRPLLDALEAADPQAQREIARWAAVRAADVAGLSGVDWIAAALDALRSGAPLPPPFDDDRRAWDRLFTDPRVPQTTITVPNRAPNVSQQAMAFPAITAAAHPDPAGRGRRCRPSRGPDARREPRPLPRRPPRCLPHPDLTVEPDVVVIKSPC